MLTQQEPTTTWAEGRKDPLQREEKEKWRDTTYHIIPASDTSD